MKIYQWKRLNLRLLSERLLWLNSVFYEKNAQLPGFTSHKNAEDQAF